VAITLGIGPHSSFQLDCLLKENFAVTARFRQPKRKLWSDDKKWLHDRYDELAQMPKTREELIADYGYDIRAASRPDGNGMTRRRGRAR